MVRANKPPPVKEDAAPTLKDEAPPAKKKEVFVPATDNIDIAKDMVNRLEQVKPTLGPGAWHVAEG